MKAICDASPLISLARLDQLALLPALFDEVVIAAEVHHEVVIAGAGRPAANAVQDAPWLRVQPCPDTATLGNGRYVMHSGPGNWRPSYWPNPRRRIGS